MRDLIKYVLDRFPAGSMPTDSQIDACIGDYLEEVGDVVGIQVLREPNTDGPPKLIAIWSGEDD